MKFKDTIYAKRKLLVDVNCPKTGEMIIPAFRILTKKHIMKAAECGVEITQDMMYVPYTNKKTGEQRNERREKRIAWLKDHIARRQSELDSLLANVQSEPRGT